jgi:hypothetical protein
MPQFVSPGAMAGNAIQKFLMQREEEEQQRVLAQLIRQKQEQDAALALRDRASKENAEKRRIGLEDEDRRIAAEDRTRTIGRQDAQDAVAAGTRRQAQNTVGVRQKMAAGLQSGADPRQVQLQAFGEGVEIPDDVLNPGAAQAKDERDFKQQKELARLQGDLALRTVRENRAASDTIGTKPDAQGTADTIGLLNRFETHPGTPKAYGIINSRTAPFSQDAQDAIAVRDQLVAALTLPNLGVLKGAASDNDVRFMKQMSSRLTNPTISMNEVQSAIRETRTYLQRRQAEEAGMGRSGAPAPTGGGGVVRWGRDAQGRPVPLGAP